MIELPQPVIEFMDLFQKNNYKIYLVGGAVRDLLHKKTTGNFDFTTNATPEEIMKLFPDSFYNNSFGTVGIPCSFGEVQVIFEVTPFRKESDYSDFRHPEKVEWTDNIDDDLARRDFTINAMAFDGQKIIDLHEGQKDMEAKLVRAVGDPDKRFNEDALRLLRAVRFATVMNFKIEENTKAAVIRNKELIKHISWERIREEFFKIILSENAADGILLLREVGLLEYILPELEVCFAIDQRSPNRHHTDDVGTHLVKSLNHCPSTDVITRFATLIHDVGKAKTFRKEEETGQVTFYNHEVVGEQLAKEIAERFKLSNDQKEKLVRLVANHQFTVSELQTDKALRRFIRSVGKEYLQDMLDLRTGDRIGSGAKPSSWRLELFKKRLEEVQNEPFAVKDLKVDGHDVMRIFNIKPSKRIGEILEEVFTEVEEKRIENNREDLLKLLQQKKV